MLTYGFYNSVNRDRRYDAEQIGAMFDGLINDGIYANYKEAMKIVPGSGKREIVIRPGRAWFNGTWTLVDGNGHSFYIMGSQVETTYYIYLYVGKNDRQNSIAWYSEVRESRPEDGKFYHLMGQVTIPAGVNTITEDMIVDLRGSSHCPFVTGILETADFEQIVRETCEENWLLWLNSYEEGLDGKVAQIQAIADKANTSADLAIATVQNLRHLAYRWAKYHAVLVQGGSLGWVLAIDTPNSGGEPPKRILYRELTFDGVNCTLSDPVSTTGISAADQHKNYRSAPYFNGDGYGGTVVGNVYRYERMVENVKISGNSVTITYGYRISCAKIVEGAYKPGAYIKTVEAKYPSEYPLDGYKDGYWYTRFASQASDVFFDNTGLSMSARTVQEAIVALTKLIGSGSGSGSPHTYIEVDRLPDTGISGAIYIVKNPTGGDSDEYIWVDRWEKLGGVSASGENVALHIGPDEPTGDNRPMYWLDTSGDTPSGPDEPENVTLTGITASYTGGDVAIGTSLDALTGITVTAQYNDGSSVVVTDYSLSGSIVEGSNTVTVTYQGMTATFTVTGVASGGGELPDISTFVLDVQYLGSLSSVLGGDVSGRSNPAIVAAGNPAANLPITDYLSSGYDVLYAISYRPNASDVYGAATGWRAYRYGDLGDGVPVWQEQTQIAEISISSTSGVDANKLKIHKLVRSDILAALDDGYTESDIRAIVQTVPNVGSKNYNVSVVWMTAEPTEEQQQAIIAYFEGGGN